MLTIEEVSRLVNEQVTKAKTPTIVKIANEVFQRDWEYLNVRKKVRIDGEDYSEHSAYMMFHQDLYGQASSEDIVGIYNILNKSQVVLTNLQKSLR